MIVEHRGARPRIDPEAVVSPAAQVIGDVAIGAGSVVLAGAVVVAEGAPVRIGPSCVVMEHAVVRGAGEDACIVGNHVLIGPHAHVSGAQIEPECFVATGAVILNKAVIGRGSTIAIHGVVHVGTRCPPETFVPIGQVAFGDPVTMYAAGDVLDFHARLAEFGFTRAVFGFDSSRLTNAAATRELCRRYARSVARHRDDRVVDESPAATDGGSP